MLLKRSKSLFIYVCLFTRCVRNVIDIRCPGPLVQKRSPPHFSVPINRAYDMSPAESECTFAVSTTSATASASSFDAPPPPCARLCKKRRRRIDLSEADVVIILYKVAAAKAHMAAHGRKNEAFKTAADVLNGKVDFVSHMDAISVWDRQERLRNRRIGTISIIQWGAE